MTGRCFLVALSIFFSFSGYAQKIIDKDTYEAKNGMVFRVGDEITLGNGSNFNQNFKYVTGQDLGEGIGVSYRDKKLKIKSIKARGSNKIGKTNYLVVGSGLRTFWVDIEGAIEFNEVIVPDEFKAKKTDGLHPTFSIADELSKLKDLLDEGALTKEEFEALKKKLLDRGYN